MTVSIRAPRAGDDGRQRGGLCHGVVSIRAPRAGDDLRDTMFQSVTFTFQSAPPVRGTTTSWRTFARTQWFQSAPPVRGTTETHSALVAVAMVSIRAPRAGDDRGGAPARNGDYGFQSAPPVRGTTGVIQRQRLSGVVSIRAPRAGDDEAYRDAPSGCDTFQSAPPVRGTTPRRAQPACRAAGFNPRPPCGGRRCQSIPLSNNAKSERLRESAPGVRSQSHLAHRSRAILA